MRLIREGKERKESRVDDNNHIGGERKSLTWEKILLSEIRAGSEISLGETQQ